MLDHKLSLTNLRRLKSYKPQAIKPESNNRRKKFTKYEN